MKAEGSCTARELALKLLVDTDNRQSYSNLALDAALKRAGLDARDSRFCTALYYGTLERQYTLDLVIADNVDKRGKKLSSEIKNILRLGIFQLLYMDSVPDNAAVDESVRLAKKNKNPAASGFVNAVLRGFLRKDKALPTQPDRLHDLALEYSCPPPLVEKWLGEYGEDVTKAMLSGSLSAPPVTVCVNTTKATLEETEQLLREDGIEPERNKFAENFLTIGRGSIEKTKAYKLGLVHAQDLSSRLCCEALGAQPGETVLDICAAPGGKSFTVSELMQNKGRLLAFDLHENRVRLIADGANRLGLDIIEASVNNGKVFSENIPLADRILCDAPCSGLGVIRRKPEIKYKDLSEFERLPQIQYEILETSLRYLRPGGRLIYSTCTLSRAENDEVADRLLKEHPELSPCELGGPFKGSRVTISCKDYDSDGFFIAGFSKR